VATLSTRMKRKAPQTPPKSPKIPEMLGVLVVVPPLVAGILVLPLQPRVKLIPGVPLRPRRTPKLVGVTTVLRKVMPSLLTVRASQRSATTKRRTTTK